MSAPVFKEYDRDGTTFLPPCLDELMDSTHMVRFVDHVIDYIDLDPILATYSGGGTSSYHPRMMMVLIYGYVERTCSCRAIAKAVCERIPFMWLAGGQRPDFRTINNFRKQRLPEGGIRGVFTQVVGMPVELELVDLYHRRDDRRPMPVATALYGRKTASTTVIRVPIPMRPLCG